MIAPKILLKVSPLISTAKEAPMIEPINAETARYILYGNAVTPLL